MPPTNAGHFLLSGDSIPFWVSLILVLALVGVGAANHWPTGERPAAYSS